MGRNKIVIEPITSDRNKLTTFLKRRCGLLKKAMEVSILCGCEVTLIISGIHPKLASIRYSSYKDFNIVAHNDKSQLNGCVDFSNPDVRFTFCLISFPLQHSTMKIMNRNDYSI